MRWSDRVARLIAIAISLGVAGITIRTNSFVAWGTDSAAYLTAAHRWAQGEIFSPSSFVFWAPWAARGLLESPLGNVPGAITGTIVGVYPLGYPILLAASLATGDSLAPYLVSPLFAALLSWCAYVLASQLSTRWAGVAASLLIATTPITLANTTTLMSDVPAAALWALAWVMALRPGLGAGLAAGLSAALAMMVRPNLAPLAVAVVLALFASNIEHRWRRIIAFGLSAALGPALLLWSQAVQYGDPLKLGYQSEAFFSTDRIAVNAAHYPRLLVGLHSWLAFAGLLIVPFAPWLGSRRHIVIVVSAVALIGVNFALYLPYLTFEGWYWLRFMFPAMLALFVLLGGVLDRMRLLLSTRNRWLQALAAVPLAFVVAHPRAEIQSVFVESPQLRRVQTMGRYLERALPANAVILAYLQSGGAAFYTGRPILRMDLIDGKGLEVAVADLRRHGFHPVVVVEDQIERAEFPSRYAGSGFAAFDWPPRAEFWSSGSISYYDPVDRTRFLNGERWPIDILVWPVRTPFRGEEGRIAVPLEPRVPPVHESLAFRGALDEQYRVALGRAAMPSSVDARTAVVWTQRYLRYRLHGCDHESAVARIVTQLEGGEIPPVCGSSSTAFPPRDHVVDFRRRLETHLRGRTRAVATTHLDLEGEAIWLEEYMRYRVSGCTNEEALTRVLDQVIGKSPAATCTSG